MACDGKSSSNNILNRINNEGNFLFHDISIGRSDYF